MTKRWWVGNHKIVLHDDQVFGLGINLDWISSKNNVTLKPERYYSLTVLFMCWILRINFYEVD